MRKSRTILTNRQRKWWRFTNRLDDKIEDLLGTYLGCLLMPITLPAFIVLKIIHRLVFKVGLRILKFIERDSVEYLIEYSEVFKLEEEVRRFEAEKRAEETGSVNSKT